MRLGLDKVAWIHLERRRLLVTRNRGRAVFYLPGGRRVPGETDAGALIREITEELSVEILSDTMRYFSTTRSPDPSGPSAG